MPFNMCTNGDPRSFMYYKNDYYINGTEVALKDEYIKNRKFNGKKLWKYARFDHQVNNNGQTAYFFTATKLDWLSLEMMGLPTDLKKDHATYFVLTPLELGYAIEEVTKPIKLSKKETDAINNSIMEMIEHPKSDWDCPSLRWMWIVYIAVMIGSLIFKEFYIPWIIATALFLYLRKGVLKQ